jgi:glycosyltransferase involved in cell wall biosynthesis
METNPPQVTVLMPVRNGAAHLPASLRSIFSQTYANFELLVIDDGSSDATAEILRAIADPRLHVITHPQNRGLIATLNEGLKLARGEFVARQDHDDLSQPTRLQKQIAYLRAHPDCVMVGSQALQIGDDDRPALALFRPRETETIRWYSCFDNPFIHSAVMFRRTVACEEFGGYPASLHSEDYALWSRIARRHPTANLPEPLLHFREHATSVTGSLAADTGATFDLATSAIREENLRALFGEDDHIQEDARILSTYRRPFTAESAAAFVRVFQRRRESFIRMGHDHAEFRRVCAMQMAELAYRLLPVSRRQAFGRYRQALALHPGLAAELPWVRLLALFVLGNHARSLYQRFVSNAGRALS